MLVSLRTASVVSAPTKRSIRRKPFSVRINLFASPASTVLPTKPAAALAVASSVPDISDNLIAVPLPCITSSAVSKPLTMSPPLPAAAAPLTAPATNFSPGSTGTDKANTPSIIPDIRLYGIDPSSKTTPAIPRPMFQALPPGTVPLNARTRWDCNCLVSPPTKNPDPAWSGFFNKLPKSVDANHPLVPAALLPALKICDATLVPSWIGSSNAAKPYWVDVFTLS